MIRTLTFTQDRETKGTMRYAEVVAEEFTEPVIGTLYVRKSAFKELGKIPQQLTLTLNAE